MDIVQCVAPSGSLESILVRLVFIQWRNIFLGNLMHAYATVHNDSLKIRLKNAGPLLTKLGSSSKMKGETENQHPLRIVYGNWILNLRI